MKTIRKNATRKIKAIAEGIKTITVFSLDNYFRGESYTPETMYGIQKYGSTYNWIMHELNSFHAKLTDGGNGHYALHIHSNLWFEMIKEDPSC